MRRERVSDDIYVFTSDLYAQVTASAVVTREGIVVVDTLPFGVETQEMIEYLNSLGMGPIKYLVNTHWHLDHINGNYLFDDSVELVCHKRCQQAMQEYAPAALEEARETTPLLENAHLRIPNVVFEDGELVWIHASESTLKNRELSIRLRYSYSSP